MVFGLCQVIFKGLTELLVLGGLHHYWKRLDQLFFGIVKVLHFLYEEVLHGFCHMSSPLSVLKSTLLRPPGVECLFRRFTDTDCFNDCFNDADARMRSH